MIGSFIGLVVCMIFGIWSGAAQILIPKFDVNLLLDAIRRHEPTYFPAVPTLFIALLNHPDAHRSGVDRIRRFNSGSAPLPLEVIEQFEQMSGTLLYEGYGMTETAALAATTATLAKRKPGSIGLPVTGTECKIVDLKTGEREVPVGEAGELCVRGPSHDYAGVHDARPDGAHFSDAGAFAVANWAMPTTFEATPTHQLWEPATLLFRARPSCRQSSRR